MDYEVDFTDVESNRYLSPGIYDATLIDVTEKDGRVAPLFAWTFADATGAKAQMTTSLAPKALWKLQEVLAGFGIDATGKLKVSEAKFRKLIGRPVAIEVIAEEGDDGKTYSKVGKVWPGGLKSDPEPLPPEETEVDFDDDEIPF